MRHSKKSLLIITSSVFASSPLTIITNPQIRENQYVRSILFYLNKTSITSIIVCDNSGFDYSKHDFQFVAQQKQKEIEILSFKGDSKEVVKYGIGFGEGEILKYVIENSKILKNFTAYFKVTGRIIVKNINRIIEGVDSEKNYFNQIRNKLIIPQNKVDTRLYFCQKNAFVDNLSYSYKNVTDMNGYFLEHAYYDALKKNRVSYSEFKIIPKYSGFSGTYGKTYKDPLFKLLIKQFLKWLNLI